MLPRPILLMLFVTFCSAHVVRSDSPPRKYSTLQRMQLPHLKATHEDALRLAESRKELPPLPGLLDLCGILHAHAEDSTHTGGTRVEMLADAKRAGVKVILLTDHHRPPKDFIDDSWRGMHEGVLFIPGSEAKGFLLYPSQSIMDKMDLPLPEFVETVGRDRGLIFLSHIEERPNHAMDGLHGLEIYNRHADAKKDVAGIVGIFLQLTDPQSLQQLEAGLQSYPDEVLAAQVTYPDDYLAKWDKETATRCLTGVAANDCHHNQVLLVKMVDENTVKIGTNVDADDKFRSFSATLRPGIRQMTKGHQPGDVFAQLDFDPYFRSFRNVATHILATEQSESSVRRALQDGRAYVSHDWMCDPTGFRFVLAAGESANMPAAAIMGDEIPFASGQRVLAEFPVACHIRLMQGGQVVLERDSDRLEFPVPGPGVYRVEGWLTLDGESRPWLYSNPIYVR